MDQTWLNNNCLSNLSIISRPVITYSKLTIETLEQGVKVIEHRNQSKLSKYNQKKTSFLWVRLVLGYFDYLEIQLTLYK